MSIITIMMQASELFNSLVECASWPYRAPLSSFVLQILTPLFTEFWGRCFLLARTG